MDVSEVKFLNWIFKYNSLGIECEEHVFISKVFGKTIKLNEESIDYRWCNLNEFIDLIEWDADKDVLRKVLEFALKGEVYFAEIKVDCSN